MLIPRSRRVLPGFTPTLVTFPFVARELMSLMQSQGPDEEAAAVMLGASGLASPVNA